MSSSSRKRRLVSPQQPDEEQAEPRAARRTDRIVVDVGGTRFTTSASTLTSGSEYFERLLSPRAPALPTRASSPPPCSLPRRRTHRRSSSRPHRSRTRASHPPSIPRSSALVPDRPRATTARHRSRSSSPSPSSFAPTRARSLASLAVASRPSIDRSIDRSRRRDATRRALPIRLLVGRSVAWTRESRGWGGLTMDAGAFVRRGRRDEGWRTRMGRERRRRR